MRSETAQLRPEEFPCYEKGNHIRYYIFVEGHPVTVSLAERRDHTLNRRVKSLLMSIPYSELCRTAKAVAPHSDCGARHKTGLKNLFFNLLPAEQSKEE